MAQNFDNNKHEKFSIIHFTNAINHSKIGDLSALIKGNRITKFITTIILIFILILFFNH